MYPTVITKKTYNAYRYKLYKNYKQFPLDKL